ncbi:MAG: PHP domain-containing protein [Filifactoraceae bacterium]
MFSDGSCTPEELIHEAINQNVKAIAVTDHDSIDGIEINLRCIFNECYNIDK